jgi:hypothetical protein
MSSDLNITNSIFKGFNDKNGLMICGYEHGHSISDQERNKNTTGPFHNTELECTFANQTPRFGEVAKTWPYQKTIKKWFSSWGFPLDENGLGGNLEKSIILTNWANTQGHKMGIETKISSKLLSDEQVDNFLLHIDSFRPRVLLLMGSQLIHCLNNQKVISRFEAIVGKRVSIAKSIQQDMAEGRRFKVYFQEFQKNAGAHCQVVCFPHPSGSIGLRDGYIAQYKKLMAPIISQFS